MNSSLRHPFPLRRAGRRAFTIMHGLVGVALAIVVVAVGMPIYSALQQRKHKAVALARLGQLGTALLAYANEHDGALPQEDVAKEDSWENAAKPEAKEAWYNALPRQLGRKGVGDFASAPTAFYTEENVLFLPGANYPEKKKMVAPQFAIAFNTKLERTDESGVVRRAKLGDIAEPAKTVGLLEQGLLNEKRTLEVQSKKDYDGSPKGSAKSFVGRYGGEGALAFLDGHAELVRVADVLTERGDFPFPQTTVIWTPKADQNPNKDEATRAREKHKDADAAK